MTECSALDATPAFVIVILILLVFMNKPYFCYYYSTLCVPPGSGILRIAPPRRSGLFGRRRSGTERVGGVTWLAFQWG